MGIAKTLSQQITQHLYTIKRLSKVLVAQM